MVWISEIYSELVCSKDKEIFPSFVNYQQTTHADFFLGFWWLSSPWFRCFWGGFFNLWLATLSTRCETLRTQPWDSQVAGAPRVSSSPPTIPLAGASTGLWVTEVYIRPQVQNFILTPSSTSNSMLWNHLKVNLFQTKVIFPSPLLSLLHLLYSSWVLSHRCLPLPKLHFLMMSSSLLILLLVFPKSCYSCPRSISLIGPLFSHSFCQWLNPGPLW